MASIGSSSDWTNWGADSGTWSYRDNDLPSGSFNTADQIVCAINLWDQNDVYRLKDETYNAFCRLGDKTDGAYSRKSTAFDALFEEEMLILTQLSRCHHISRNAPLQNHLRRPYYSQHP